MIATFEIIETGRFRFSVDDPTSGDGGNSCWNNSERIGILTHAGEIYIAVSPFFIGEIPPMRVFKLVELDETEIKRIGVDE